jgi:hypothetical protein
MSKWSRIFVGCAGVPAHVTWPATSEGRVQFQGVHVVFVVDKVAMRRVYILSSFSIILQLLHIR